MRKLALKFLVCCGAFVLFGQCFTCANGLNVYNCSGCTMCLRDLRGGAGSIQNCKSCCLACCQSRKGERLECERRCNTLTVPMPELVDPAHEQLECIK